MSRIAEAFRGLAAAGRKGLIPYVCAGDPTPQVTVFCPVLTSSIEQQTSSSLHVSIPHSMLGPSQTPAPLHNPP